MRTLVAFFVVFLVILSTDVYSQVVRNVPKEGIGEESDFLRIVSTSTGSSVSGAAIQNRTYATGSRASTSSTKFPTVAAADSTIGDIQWANLDSVLTDDAKYTTSTTVSDNDSTHYLWVNDFGFDLPTDAIVTGFTVKFEGYLSDSAQALNVVVRMVKAGTITGSDYATNATISDDVTIYTFGASDSLWGSTWTIANVEDSAFGAVFMFTDTVGGTTIYVDYATIQVHYTYHDLAVSADTSQTVPLYRAKSFWVQMSAKDSISLIPQYQLSPDGSAWALAVTFDSLKINDNQSLVNKSVNLSAVADTAAYVRFIFTPSRNAYPPGTTTATYSVRYAIKRD